MGERRFAAGIARLKFWSGAKVYTDRARCRVIPFPSAGTASVREHRPAGEAARSRTCNYGWRTRLGKLFDTLVLGLAVASPPENGEALDPQYAEAMVLVFDEYFRLHTRPSAPTSDRAEGLIHLGGPEPRGIQCE